MRMLEAFKRLLNGEKITRQGWQENEHIRYDENLNAFVLHFLDDTEDACSEPCFEGGFNPYISFNGDDTDSQMVIEDDDKNEIWVTPQELMDLDAMRWRLERHCVGTTCRECRIFNPSKFCKAYHSNWLARLSDKEVKRLYNIIKEEEK